MNPYSMHCILIQKRRAGHTSVIPNHTREIVTDLKQASYGRVQESPEDCILLVNWRYTRCWAEFSQSSRYTELLADLGAQSDHAVVTQVIGFSRTYITIGLSSHTELKTVYLPASISSETREAVQDSVHRLRTTAAYGKGLRHLSPYVSKPSLGWVEGSLEWEGQDAVACVWVHEWKNKEAEERFKTTDIRAYEGWRVYSTSHRGPFEQDLEELGALGWEEKHVNFETTCYIA
jgi:hypothetical protein